ncbi:hypothetical protein [Pseudomonas chlororaphis]|uniref:hypothetical protein n=1 Tax=Pseudomonas chlororaphis TaxID=587753 RepID=UPI001926E70A|nr:hypothetical protein [Pseudomonas chlororaphis]QQX59715.1 hypothetical protein JHW28_03975 [Pseudomonas chlororaphis subsp. aurantiaca]
MDGISFKQIDQYALCRVESFSDELKQALRDNLTRICHGADQASRDRAIFKYPATIKHFWEQRYSKKTWETRIGMLGELLSHVIILKLFPDFDVVSPFFNMEEKSIRKGFDLLLYETSKNNVWITEVKSGGMGKDKTSCSATSALLRLARDDLKKRLAEPELNHWLNAINAARNAIHNKANYRDSVIEILELEGDLADGNSATASDNNVFLISALFSEVSQAIDEQTVSKFTTKLVAESVFKTVWVLSLHKGTMEKLEEFLRTEAEQ